MTKLVHSLIMAPALVAGLCVVDAMASTGPMPGTPPVASHADDALLRLAQSGEVEVYVDEYGRRVIVDAYTGEVLGYERPRVYSSREARRRAMRARELDRQYYDEEAIPYRPRAYRNGLPLMEDPDYSYREEAPRYAYPDQQDEIYPDAPEAYPAEPESARRQKVERKPLQSTERQASVDDTENPLDRVPAQASNEGSSEPADSARQPSVKFGARDDVAALQVLLDRKGASPGVIDGHFGGNVDKALAVYREITGENLHSTDAEKIKADLAASGGDAFTTYTITAEDAAGPYVAAVPADYGAKAKLDRLSYTSVTEALAERFHMDENYLKALNPGVNFGRQGTVIKVVNVGSNVTTQVVRIIADKGKKQVRAYDQLGKLVAAYPATIGSTDTPSPSGIHKVSRVAFDPEYTYNPNLNFKQGDNDKILTIPPGPNGPVGSVWIALDKPTYGIHGTPDPSKIGKTESHGCVRLTNWDAGELAKLVKPDVTVEFVD